MVGPSYLGLVQWAVAPEVGDDVVALAIQVSASQFHGQTYPGGSLALETSLTWLVAARRAGEPPPLTLLPRARAAAQAVQGAAARRPRRARHRHTR